METQPPTKKHNNRFLLVGILLLAALLVWWAWTALTRPSEAVVLPYSAFQQQVREGNVSAVTIAGDQIDGILMHPVTGPVPVTGQPVKSAPSLAFHTHFPDVVGDPNLVSLLNSNNVQITAIRGQATWLVTIEQAGPLVGLALLAVILAVAFGGGLLARFRHLNPFHHTRPLPYTIDHPTETYDSTAGQNEAVQALKSMARSGAFPPILLLAGPPGTGKTLLVKAMAGESHAALIKCQASRIFAPAATPEQLRKLFQHARSTAPAVLLIEGLHAAGRENPAAFNQLLVELDVLEAGEGLTVVGETRQPEQVELELLRPGRFSRSIALNIPNRQGREAILGLHTRGLRLANNVNLGVIARTTTGFSGADLAGLCAEAARCAKKEGHDQLTMANFEDALDRQLIQSPSGLLLNEQERRAAAYHAAGHALVAWLLPAAAPVKRISILPGSAAMHDLPSLTFDPEGSGKADPVGSFYRNTSLYSKEDILSHLAVVLGGRAAEEIAIGDVTISSENDLVEATRLARRMVTRWGMGSMGLMALDRLDNAPEGSFDVAISEETASRIDQDVQELLSARYAAVRRLLEETREPLERLVRPLLDDETLDQEEISVILGPRPSFMSDGVSALFTAP